MKMFMILFQLSRRLGRRYDAIIVKGKKFPMLLSEPIASLRLYVFSQGEFLPIPFQVAERDPQGEFIFSCGRKAVQDIDHQAFDHNDELVFLVQDNGDRVPEEAVPLKGLKMGGN